VSGAEKGVVRAPTAIPTGAVTVREMLAVQKERQGQASCIQGVPTPRVAQKRGPLSTGETVCDMLFNDFQAP